MATASYESKKQRWSLSWRKPDGTYGRRRITDKTFLKLGKREQAKVQARMTAMADSLESSTEPVELPKTAAEFFLTLKNPCTSKNPKSIREARSISRCFGEWLNDHHPAMLPGDITETVGHSYGTYIIEERGLAVETLKQHIKRISTVLKAHGHSPLPLKRITAPFKGNEETFRRELMHPEDFKAITLELLDGTQLGWNCWAAFYLGITTGWRQADILNLKWSAISLERRTIGNIHHKTKNTTGVSSTLPLTNIGMAVLKELQRVNGEGEDLFVIQNGRPRGGKRTKEERRSATFGHICSGLFEGLQQQRGLERLQRGNHKVSRLTYHSMRGTVTTTLANSGFGPDLGRSMVGHSPLDIEGKHYQQFAPKDYRECVEMMEDSFVVPALGSLEKHYIWLKDLSQRVALEPLPQGQRLLWRRLSNKMKDVGLEEWMEEVGVTRRELELYFSRHEKKS